MSMASTAGVKSRKASKFNTNCSVYGCHSKKGYDRSIHFHAFPPKDSDIKVRIVNALGQEEEMDKRLAWERVLLMGKPVTKYMRVCSKHFIKEDYCAKGLTQKQPKLGRFAVPSLNLPKRSFTKQQGKVATQRKIRFQKRGKLKKDAEEPSTVAVAETKFCEIAGDSGEIQEPRSYEQLTTDEKVAVQALYSRISQHFLARVLKKNTDQ
nr:unnamed protein product [Callosobruchus analis]